MEVYAVSRSKHVVLLTCMEFLPEAKRHEIVNKQRELVSFVRTILKEIRPERGDKASTTQVDTMLFFGMINWTYTWYHADGPVRPGDLADRAVQIFLNGYRHSEVGIAEAAGGKAARSSTRVATGGSSGRKRPRVAAG
jgi:hypothetical protein